MYQYLQEDGKEGAGAGRSRKEGTGGEEQAEGGGAETHLSTLFLSWFSTVTLTDFYFPIKCHGRFNGMFLDFRLYSSIVDFINPSL